MPDGSRSIHEQYRVTLKRLSDDYVLKLRRAASREQVEAAERSFTGSARAARTERDAALWKLQRRPTADTIALSEIAVAEG